MSIFELPVFGIRLQIKTSYGLKYLYKPKPIIKVIEVNICLI